MRSAAVDALKNRDESRAIGPLMAALRNERDETIRDEITAALELLGVEFPDTEDSN